MTNPLQPAALAEAGLDNVAQHLALAVGGNTLQAAVYHVSYRAMLGLAELFFDGVTYIVLLLIIDENT